MTMCAEQAPRSNSQGHPCPPWCTTDHVTPWSEKGYTFTCHSSDWTRIEVAGQAKTRPDEISVHAVDYADTDLEPAVIVHDSRPAADGRVPLELNGGIAGQLAGLVEMLAKATPAQHRKLAAAIRQAGALITGATGAQS